MSAKDKPISKHATDSYRSNYDRIFTKPPTAAGCVCRVCRIKKPISEFADKGLRYSSICMKCEDDLL